ncbi:matrixin family metalloprotease [Candidatus Pacearchaeota archaeon]|nr:matrixin family metalloprotease [Candidatus Pacearchaeota archaeon]
MTKYKLLITILLISLVITAISSVVAAPQLEKVTFIHYKDNGKIKTTMETKGESKAHVCYKLLGAKLPSTVGYQINPTNAQSLSESFVTSAISSASTEWDSHTATSLFNTYTVNYSANYGAQDGVNAISFGDFPQAGVIAVTSIWIGGTAKNRLIVEFDIEFDTDWNWGDATATSGVMDLQNIATHELGHAIGLGDLYNYVCNQETMYGYSDYNEIKKRTLNTGDLAGLKKLYGI